MEEKHINYHLFDDEELFVDLDIRTEIHFSGKDHPGGKMVPVIVEDHEEYILIPIDIKDGAELKIKGRGKHNSRTGKTGDLYVLVHIGETEKSPNWLAIFALVVVLFAVAFGIGALFARMRLSSPVAKQSSSNVSVESSTTPVTYKEPVSPETTVHEETSVRVGDILAFGNYEQDGVSANGPEPIEWVVLDIQEDKALLLSCDALDSKPYNDAYTSVTWETSSIRQWLNGAFFNNAFTQEQKKQILVTEVDNSRSQGNREWNSNGSNHTEDVVFLLSYAETKAYLFSDYDRMCVPTDYAIANGADIRVHDDGITESGWSWLRSPGEKNHHAAFVNFDGAIYSNAVGNEYLSVRPALWVHANFE